MKPAEPAIQERVDRLFDRFERMTDAEFMLLRTVWDGEDATVRQDAWTIVKATVRLRRREKFLDVARDRIAAWVNNYSAPLAQGEVPVGYSLSGMDANSIRRAAIPPMLDAIAAVVAADGLGQHDETVLLEPLRAVAPHSASE